MNTMRRAYRWLSVFVTPLFLSLALGQGCAAPGGAAATATALQITGADGVVHDALVEVFADGSMIVTLDGAEHRVEASQVAALRDAYASGEQYQASVIGARSLHLSAPEGAFEVSVDAPIEELAADIEAPLAALEDTVQLEAPVAEVAGVEQALDPITVGIIAITVITVVAIAAIVYMHCTATQAQVTAMCLSMGCRGVDASSKTEVVGTGEVDTPGDIGDDEGGRGGETGGTIESTGMCSWECYGCGK